MNVAVAPSTLSESRRLARPARYDRFTLGMPELCLGGLSETWLLKACGDLHWRLIAEAAGRDRPDFRDAGGERIYAAFRALRAEDLELDSFAEHDELGLLSEVAQVSRTRFASRHALLRGGRAAGVVELLSAFVKRDASGANRSIARAVAAGVADGADAGADWAVRRLANDLRGGAWRDRFAFRAEDVATASYEARPCPSQDFNGADLLYFVSYPAFADRAEWELLDPPAAGATTRVREVVFHGNIEPGERIRARFKGVGREGGSLGHWIGIESATDGRRLADIFTLKSGAVDRGGAGGETT